MFRTYFFIGFSIVALLSFVFPSESVMAKMPEQCQEFTASGTEAGYQELYKTYRSSPKAAFRTLESKANHLLERITAAHQEQLASNQSTDNLNLRNELRLKSFATRDYFQETFGFLRRSACIREDVNKLEDMLSAIRLIALKTPEYLDEIETLQKEISALRLCSKYKESVYYDEQYEKSKCEGGEKEKTSHIKKKFTELKEKIKNLTSGAEWKGILNKQGWKSGVLKDYRTEIREDKDKSQPCSSIVCKKASSWINNNSLVKLLDYERYFGSQIDNTEAREAVRDARNKDVEAERAGREELAIQKGQLSDAFQSLSEEKAKIADEIANGEKFVDAAAFTVLTTSTAEYWKQEVAETAILVQKQTEFVKKQKEALRKLINRHGINIPDEGE